MELTPRKREILRRVVEEYVSTGQPVGSKALVENAGIGASPSTVRGELADLEALGLLTHPHTSAGRVPTESGYRIYAEELVDSIEGRPARMPARPRCDAERARCGAAVDHRDALAGDAAARIGLGAVARVRDRPPRRGAGAAAAGRDGRPDHDDGRRHEAAVRDRGPRRQRAGRLGEGVPERAGRRRPARHEHAAPPVRRPPVVRRASAGFSTGSALRSSSCSPSRGTQLYVGGAAGLLGDARAAEELEACQRLLELLERRAAVIELLSEALDPRRPVVRVGPAIEGAEFHDVSYVGAHYGLTNRDARHRRPARPAAHGLRDRDPVGAGRRLRAFAPRRGGLRGGVTRPSSYS